MFGEMHPTNMPNPTDEIISPSPSINPPTPTNQLQMASTTHLNCPSNQNA